MATVPASGVCSLSNLQAAFGGQLAEVSLSSFYANTSQGLWTTGVPSIGSRISLSNFRGKFQGGSQIFTTVGANLWTVPDNITSIDIVCVGGGGGSSAAANACFTAGGGGALAYINNVNVTPGEILTVNVGVAGTNSNIVGTVGTSGGASSVVQNGITIVLANGGSAGSLFTTNAPGGTSVSGGGGAGGTVGIGTGGAGGRGGNAMRTTSVAVNGTSWTNGTYGGGGGAGGYSGPGGNGGDGDRRMVPVGTATTSTGGAGGNGQGGGGGGGGGQAMITTISTTTPTTFINYPNSTNPCAGGGVGLYGEGTSGAGGTTRTVVYDGIDANIGTGPTSGGSGSAIGNVYGRGGIINGNPQQGAVRIVWPATTRAFPSTLVSTQ